VPVVLYEMRPRRSTPAHKTGELAELVCSNSLRSDDPLHASGLLKREMEAFGSLIVAAARQAAVPAGSALAVDRVRFAAAVTETLAATPGIEIRREEVLLPPEGDAVLATGPLTSDALASKLEELLGGEHLYFYDAIAPIVEGSSLDHSRLYWGSRYGKGGDDYLNAPMNQEEYLAFHQAVVDAEVLPLHDFEAKLFFEGCLPIEELARRGVDTLRFGPMKPVGLTAPDGSRAYAVVQLRRESLAHDHLNLVGFQSRMKWGEQKRVLGMIPGLAGARWVRLGQIHRNTFINSPRHLDRFYRLSCRPGLRLAGQITGVEGYLESAATGLATGLYLALERGGGGGEPLPATTALGALMRHLVDSAEESFQPANVNYGLFPDLPRRLPRKLRRRAHAERAAADLASWAARQGLELAPPPPAAVEAATAEAG
jgi:methylenetetrahydrofolate--tRNA-(uracil-5-)-methyltransferase